MRALVDLRGEEFEPVRAIFQTMGRRLRLVSDTEASRAERDDPHAERDGLRDALGATCTERDAFRDERDREISSLRAAEERLAIVHGE